MYRPATLLALLVLLGCGDRDPVAPSDAKPPFLADIETVPFTLLDVPNDELWFTGVPIQSLDYVQDARGVPLFQYDGRLHYHPVLIIEQGLYNLDSYKQSGDERYLEYTKEYVDRLVKEADLIDGALYFPYTFDFRLHGFSTEVLQAPWYSGMAQGEMLSLLTRLYYITLDDRYVDLADQAFQSFLRPKGLSTSYTVSVDSAGYYWIDEYPGDPPNEVLNGFIFAIYGLYEYNRLAEYRADLGDRSIDPAVAAHVLKASLTTVQKYVERFRVQNAVSYYCLRHKVQSLGYHRIHVRQLRDLHRVTGEPYFEDMADVFDADAS